MSDNDKGEHHNNGDEWSGHISADGQWANRYGLDEEESVSNDNDGKPAGDTVASNPAPPTLRPSPKLASGASGTVAAELHALALDDATAAPASSPLLVSYRCKAGHIWKQWQFGPSSSPAAQPPFKPVCASCVNRYYHDLFGAEAMDTESDGGRAAFQRINDRLFPMFGGAPITTGTQEEGATPS